MWTSQYVARSSDAHASYPVFVHRLARLLHASFRPRLQTSDLAAAIALAFCYPSPPSGWEEDFHLQAVEHAQHTTKPLARRTLPRVYTQASELPSELPS